MSLWSCNDLTTDRSEKINVASQQADVVARIEAYLKTARDRVAELAGEVRSSTGSRLPDACASFQSAATDLEAGSWKLEAGNWKLAGAGSWKLEADTGN